jgi:hypothetical protein
MSPGTQHDNTGVVEFRGPQGTASGFMELLSHAQLYEAAILADYVALLKRYIYLHGKARISSQQ